MSNFIDDNLHPSLIENSSFSACSLYRWSLKRTVNKGTRTLLFIGLNPSKANSFRNDQTIRRLISFCNSLGYGNLIVLNLFARISKSPKILKLSSDPIGEDNDKFLSVNAFIWSINSLWDLCLGWGHNGGLFSRSKNVLDFLRIHFINRSIFCKGSLGPLSFGLTSEGYPRHPLYLPIGTQLKPFDWEENCLAELL